jgi:hypothetical protein
MSAIKTSLPFALIVALTLSNAHAEEAPEIGDRTRDGFVVKCYWTGVFDKTEWFGGQGMIGTFGQLSSSPLNGTQKSHAFFFATQEVDNTGKLRTVVRDAQWSSTVSHLHYWSRENDKPGAGPGGKGSGAISAADLQVSATDGQKTAKGQSTVNLSVNINTTSDAYKFDVRYHPLEMKSVVEVRVSSEIKSTKWDADIFGLSVSDEPVKPHQTTTIRQEWDIPGTNFRARWLVTRSCETAEVHLVYPKGTQQQYTFNSDNPGVLYVYFKAAVTPGGQGALEKIRDRVRFEMDGIGSSKMEWDPATPNGKPIVEAGFLQAKLKFTGLPSKNDDFGKKKVQLLLDGQLIESATVKVFFPKLATNHPGGKSSDPNWFYYWKEGDVCGIAANDIFDGDAPRNTLGYSVPWIDHNVRLCRLAALSNQGPVTYFGFPPWGSVVGCGSGKGIKCVAEILQHERHHLALYDAFVAQSQLYGVSDPDGDMIPTTGEGTTDGIASDPADPDTFNIRTSIPDYATYGDDEIRCRKEELKHTVRYYPEKDWADPGCQTTTPYGP